MVKQMPMVAANKQPIIAIITAQYCEKMAVDSMIENKETFVKFKTEGNFLKIFTVYEESLQLKNILIQH